MIAIHWGLNGEHRGYGSLSGELRGDTARPDGIGCLHAVK